MTDQLCTRQVCFIMAAYTAAGKLLMMPAELSYYCGGDLWLPAFIVYVLQVAAVWAVAFACSKTDKTFFALIEGVLGKAASKVFSWLFALFFALAAVLPMFGQKLFVQAIFYDTIPALITFLPFFVFSVYAGAKGLKNAGRVADIALPLMGISLIVLFAMSVGEANVGWLLPVLRTTSASSVFSGARFSLYNFTDGAMMLMLMGRFRYKKGDSLKITLIYALSALVVLLFLVLFYSIFSVLSPDQYFAISKMAIFFSALSIVGRVDLIAVYAVEICMLFALAFYIQLSVTCVCGALGKEQSKGRSASPASAVASVAINAVLLAVLIAFNNSYLVVQEAFGRFLWIVFVLFAFVLPPLVWALKRGMGGGANGKVSGGTGKKAGRPPSG